MFGMGTGVTLSLWPPKIEELYQKSDNGRRGVCKWTLGADRSRIRAGSMPRVRKSSVEPQQLQEDITSKSKNGQAARLISTSKLHVLPRFHTWPINVVVFNEPSGGLRHGISYLGVGFPLRCFQRLSLPNIATLRCGWRHNRNTIGSSIPVLSY